VPSAAWERVDDELDRRLSPLGPSSTLVPLRDEKRGRLEEERSARLGGR
jgi:hypothetical protein